MRRFILIIIVFVFCYGVWYRHGLAAVNRDDTADHVVTIQPGSSLTKIATLLAEQGMIRSRHVFMVQARLDGLASHLQAGSFLLKRSQSITEILATLHEGIASESRITIPEGLTIADIDALMASRGFGERGDIIRCAFTCDFSSFDFLPTTSFVPEPTFYGSKLEGYAFPETYAVNISPYTPKFFLERMLGEFKRRIIAQYGDEMKASGRSLQELVIMASLVEEESRHDDERAIIAGILWKRLANHVVLGVDAVNRYEAGKKQEPLLKKELETITPYNSRRTQGLPPTPIANPSEASFVAALRPKDSPYWYYLHDKNGVIRFAVSNDEHNANKYRYLR